ncbi:unnamed protein product [Ilex paraguariensis]|uniref:Uncharacterized protein n=1 Tax=Ilex paraguariensis TaxID=185542 RepID=A0ABC8SEF0_9AQUA
MSGVGAGGIRVWRRRGKARDWEFMELDVGGGERVPTLDAKLDLAAVGGGGYVVDWYVVGGYKAREVEELVEMALSC